MLGATMVLQGGTAVLMDNMKRTYHKFFVENVDENFQMPESSIEQIHNILMPLSIDDESLKKIMHRLNACFDAGLATFDPRASTLGMLASYVRSLPNGTEQGNFLALDLGGTNFRVLLIQLRGRGRQAEMTSKIYRIPNSLMIGSGQNLFDHIADCLATFIIDHDLTGHKLPLGFTFSFPCAQDGLTSAKLINWTKGFKCSGVEGEDVVQLLCKAIARRKDVDIDVVALLNDTVGTLMALAHEDPNCTVGIIVGTGTNACYMERMSRITKLPGHKEDPGEMIINTEWGAFGDRHELDEWRTEFDQAVDRNSINPGRQVLEKMISGMYMGELVRLILEKLTTDGLLFEGNGSDDLYTKGKFPTKFVSEIEADLLEDEKTFTSTMNILDELGIENATQVDCANVAYVCSQVSTRAAYLTAAGISVILNRMEKPEVTVGVDGSVYRFHPTFKSILGKKMQELLTFPCTFTLKLSEDGSGRGAALVAAVATRLKTELLAQQLEQARITDSGGDSLMA